MKTRMFFSLFSLVLMLSACGGQSSGDSNAATGGKDSSGMGQFASDTGFQAAHPIPADLQFTGTGEMIQFATPDGQKGSAYALLPKEKTGKFLFVIHEWWGLNDHIKAEAERLYGVLDSSVAVLALDMYDGKVATSPDQAGELMNAVKEARAQSIIQGALSYAGKDARIGTIGWCFGGGWSLRASIMAGGQAEACVMYYGMPVQNAKDLASLKAPVLGIFAKQDQWINEKVVNDFQNLAKATGKNLEVLWYDADHAFANPSNPKFDQEAAKQANEQAWAFLEKELE